MIVLLTKCYAGDKFEKNEMVGTYSKYREDERHIQGFGEET